MQQMQGQEAQPIAQAFGVLEKLFLETAFRKFSVQACQETKYEQNTLDKNSEWNLSTW